MALVARFLPYAGWPLAALIFWFYLGVRDDLAAEIERCNSDKFQSALESSELARQAQQEAADRRISELEAIALASDNARRIADKARQEAESRPAQIREVIRNVPRETLAQQCLDLPIDTGLLQCLREPEGCGEAGPGGDSAG